MKTLYALIIIHLKELFRTPEILFWGIGFPVLMALGLGIAFSSKQEVVRSVAILTNDNSYSNTLTPINIDGQKIERFEREISGSAIGKNRIIFHKIPNEEWGHLLLKRGIVVLIIIIKGTATTPTYLFDPRNVEAQLSYMITRALIENNTAGLIDHQYVTALDVPGTRYVDFLLPGLITMGVMMSCMWGISYGLIERRSKKLLRRLVATPMNKSSFLFSQVFVRILFGLFECAILILFAFLFFDFKVYGSYSLLLALYICGHFAFSGLAILVASRTTTIESGTGIINFITTPMIILSGIFFSYQHFPEWAKIIISNLPLTVLTDSLRRVILEGGGFLSISNSLIWLIIMGFICYILGLKIFKWY
ncbi:MAG: ABC transporter permease [Oligoflexia bacterium]|nr:ABC transporter permease [Oligoflexia bacterium]